MKEEPRVWHRGETVKDSEGRLGVVMGERGGYVWITWGKAPLPVRYRVDGLLIRSIKNIENRPL